MYRRIIATAGTAVAIVGIGTAALATSGSTSTTAGTGHTTSQRQSQHQRRHELHRILRHVLHAQVTTKGPDGYVTHSGIRGTVTAISPTSITVKAADGYAETFTISSTTRERHRTAGRHGATKGSVTDVKTGDEVGVLGKAPDHSSAPPVARVVVDGVRK